MKDTTRLKGIYHFVHKDKHGKILDEWDVENLVTNEGQNFILNAAIHNQTSIADWFFAIYTDGSANVAHTYAVPGRTEATSAISEALRQGWGEGAAASQSITNAVAATITANGALTVAGVGVVGSPTGASGDDTKGDVACSDGILLSDSDVSKSLADSETLDITYTLSTANQP